MPAWYEQDDFWTQCAPFLFQQRRWEQAPEEVEKIVSLLKVRPGACILDLCCGPGRHCLQLARAGFSVTGLDRTKVYLEKARKRAEREGLNIEFIQGDMRDFCRPDSFDAVINVYTSFGYFEDTSDDKKVAINVCRSLKDNGVFLIDTMGKEVVARVFRERDWYQVNDVLALQERKVSRNWSWMEGRWIIVKDRKAKEYRISHRLHSAAEFAAIDVYGDLTGAPYDHTATSSLLLLTKETYRSDML